MLVNEIKDRGWIWEITDKHTQWLAVKCLDCEAVHVYSSNTSDGTMCKLCGGVDMPLGYVKKTRMEGDR